MKVETACLKQKVVLWPFDRFDRDGEAVVSDTPVELSAKYETSISTQRAANQNPHAKPATVFVDRAVDLQGQIWLGKLEDLPDPLTNLFEVTEYSAVGDIKGRETTHVIRLMRK